jgi:hypothetical protein
MAEKDHAASRKILLIEIGMEASASTIMAAI